MKTMNILHSNLITFRPKTVFRLNALRLTRCDNRIAHDFMGDWTSTLLEKEMVLRSKSRVTRVPDFRHRIRLRREKSPSGTPSNQAVLYIVDIWIAIHDFIRELALISALSSSSGAKVFQRGFFSRATSLNIFWR